MHWPWSALGRERSVIHGVPVSRCEHGQSAADEFGQAGVESRQDLFALFDRQSTAGQQVSLHINHKQRITLPELKTRPMRSGARALQGLICEHGHHACMMEGRVFATLSLRNAPLLRSDDGERLVQAALRFLQDPASWMGFDPQCRQIETIETQMSWVFLGRRCALKLKKPLKTTELDFSTLSQRLHFCQEEVRLNRRLAPQVYRGLMSWVVESGRWRLRPWDESSAGPRVQGELVDCLVWMRRLPARRMMHRLVATHQLQPREVDQLGEVMAQFYSQAQPVSMDPEWWMARYQREWTSNAQVLLGPWGAGLAASELIQGAQAAAHRIRPLLDQRCRETAFVEGHGDLRPEHVCFSPHPIVIDALEFNAQLRAVDPADEMGYLVMECQVQGGEGADWVGPRLWQAWKSHSPASRPCPHPALRHFYRLRRALLRARLSLAHLMVSSPRTPQRWRPLAGRYLRVARSSLEALQATQWDRSRAIASANNGAADSTVTF